MRFAAGFGIAALFTMSETWITIADGCNWFCRAMAMAMNDSGMLCLCIGCLGSKPLDT
jgi:hypothetical protein